MNDISVIPQVFNVTRFRLLVTKLWSQLEKYDSYSHGLIQKKWTLILFSMVAPFATNLYSSHREVDGWGSVGFCNSEGPTSITIQNKPVFICCGCLTAEMSQTFK